MDNWIIESRPAAGEWHHNEISPDWSSTLKETYWILGDLIEIVPVQRYSVTNQGDFWLPNHPPLISPPRNYRVEEIPGQINVKIIK